jgi:EmrB/QacA subfamily drug resistance transporter
MTDVDSAPVRVTEARARSTRGPALTVVLMSLAYFMMALDALVVVTALPAIHRDLGGSLSTLQWTANAYNTAFAAGIITATALGDRLGRKRVFLVGLVLFTTASAACALAPGVGTLIAFRTVQGLGAAAVMPLALTMLTSAFPPERRGSVVGIWGGVAGLGVAAGPLIGGGVTQGLNWHWIFWVNVPVGIAVITGVWRFIGESKGPKARLDLPALVLLSGGVAVLVWGLVQAPQVGWGNTKIVVSLALGAALIAAFIGWEARAPEPMIRLGLFRIASFSSAVATQFLLSASIYSAAFITSEYFQLAKGDSPLGAGLRFLPLTATPLIIAPIAGALCDRTGTRPLVVPGLLMQGAGFAWIVFLSGTSAGYPAYIPAFVIAGIGVSMALPCVSVAGLNAVEPQWLGKAAGMLNTMQLFGGTCGITIITVVFNGAGSLAGPAAVTHGFRPAIATSACLSVLGALTALGLRARH